MITETTKRTIKLRAANANEGEAIHQLCLAAGMWEIEGVDWNRAIDNWWVAEDEDGLVGCVQCLMGWPYSHNEFLFIHPRLTHREKAITVRNLCELAAAYQSQAGAQVVSFSVPEHMNDWKEVAKGNECVEWFKGTMLLRRV